MISPSPAVVPRLSVVLVAVSGAASITRTMRHLRAQTARGEMEVIIVAPTADAIDVAAISGDQFAACRVVAVGPITARGAAAAAGMLAATASIVGLIEDHSYPESRWAEALLDAHAGAWAAVGPAVENGNPESTMSWVNYILGYGAFSGGVTAGERAILPWHNSAYKRASLLPFADRLGTLLEWEGELQELLRADGQALYLEPRARTHHSNVSRFTSTVSLNLQRGRILGALRASRERWPYWRRIVQAAGWPLFPLLQYRHLAPTLPLMAIPASLRSRVYVGLGTALCAMAIGEAWGLATGIGDSMSRLEDYELHRSKHLTRRELRTAELDSVGAMTAPA